MACNGYNHPPDCVCNFKGGHPNSQPPRPFLEAPLLGSLAPPIERSLFKRRRVSHCRKCGMPIHFVLGPKGGSFIAAGDGSFLRHNCPKAVPDRPVRLKKAHWRRDWYPAALSIVRSRGDGQVVSVAGLVEGGPFKVRIQDGLEIDSSQPAVCRWSLQDSHILEIAYVDVATEELTTSRVRARRLRG